MFFVDLSKRAEKYLSKLDKRTANRIGKKLKETLSLNPIPKDSKFMGRHKGEMVFRYRIGDFRALYKVKHKENIILIAKIDKRPRIYQRD